MQKVVYFYLQTQKNIFKKLQLFNKKIDNRGGVICTNNRKNRGYIGKDFQVYSLASSQYKIKISTPAI